MVRFTRHAEAKLRERMIPKGFVLRVLAKPDFARPSYGNRTVAYRRFDGRYLSVIFRREREDVVVITEHWISKLRRTR